MNLTKEQILKLKELYSKEIGKMAKKNDLKKSELNNKYKNALTIAIIVVSIVGALIGGTLVGTIIHKLLTAIYSNITLSGVSILSSLLGVVISNGFFVKFGIPKLKDLTGYSKGIKEYDGVSEICSSLKDKTQLDYIGFNDFINKLNILLEKDIRNREFIDEMAIDLDFFVENQNRRLYDKITGGKADPRIYYKLSESFSRLVYDNIDDIKEIFRVLICKAQDYHKYNESMHQKSQEKMFMELPRVFSNVPEYHEIFGNSNSTTMQYMPNQSGGYQRKLPILEERNMQKKSQAISSEPPQIINMQYLNPQISKNSVLSRKVYSHQFNRVNQDDSRSRKQ